MHTNECVTGSRLSFRTGNRDLFGVALALNLGNLVILDCSLVCLGTFNNSNFSISDLGNLNSKS